MSAATSIAFPGLIPVLLPEPSTLAKYSPVHYVKADTVPTVFGHGEQDEIVPYRNALDLDERLTEQRFKALERGVKVKNVPVPDDADDKKTRAQKRKLQKMIRKASRGDFLNICQHLNYGYTFRNGKPLSKIIRSVNE